MSDTIAIAAGGTGGHMFPAEALAHELKRRGHGVLLLTDDRGMRFASEFPADNIVILDAANPNVSGIRAKAAMALAMANGVRHARRALKNFNVDMTIGFGGYPSAPGLAATRLTRRPFAVHEQNAVLGRVNRAMATAAEFVAHGFPRLDRIPEGVREVAHLGNPVRGSVVDAARTEYIEPTESGSVDIVVFGGSQGARLFGDVFPQAFATLPEPLRQRLRIVQQVSEEQKPEVADTYAQANIACELAPFFSNLPERMAAAHFVVARAGASSVSEIATIGRPALLIPLAIAMDDHQRANAEVLSAVGAAHVLLESELSAESASAVLLPMLSDPTALKNAAQAALGQVPAFAAEMLATKIEKVLGERR